MAPPLKSTSTRFSSADECVATRPRTSVLSSSLLPEPVAPDAEAVRPAAALGGLLEVQRHRAPRPRRPRSARAAGPRRAGGAGARAVDLRRRSDRRPARCTPARDRAARAGPRRRPRPASGAGSGGPVAGEAAGQRRGLRDGEGVRPADGAQTLAVPGPSRTGRPTRRGGARRPASAACPGGAPTRSTVVPATAAHEPGPAASSTTTSRCGSSAAAPGARPASSASHHRRTSSACAVTIRTGPTASRYRGWPACGSHFTHSHSGARYGGADHGQQRVGRAVPQHVLRHQRAGQCAGGLGPGARRGLEPDRRGAAQRQRDRQVGDDRVRPQEAAQGQRRDRLEPVHRARLRGDQRRWPAAARPVPARSRPKSGSVPRRSHNRPGGEHRRPGCGIRVHVLQRRPLLGGDGSHPAPRGRQVAQVVAPFLVDRRLPLARAAAPAADEQHPDRRQREHAAEHQRRRVARTQGDEPDRAQQHHRRAATGRGARAGRAAPARAAARSSSSPPGRRGTARGGRGTSTVLIAPPFLRCGPGTGRTCDFSETGPRGTPARR